MTTEEFRTVQRELEALARAVQEINKNVLHVNRATFGDSEPDPENELAVFGHSIGSRSKGIDEALTELIKGFRDASSADG